jgi:glutamyl-tRNA synthetase
MTVRTRFAPSPTGFLHIGGARLALYCWLFARAHNGAFILRIEDTDLERSTPEAVTAILDGMQWLGLDYDEGPFFQTQRMQRYQTVIQQLLDENKAYRCYCSKERLEQLREQQVANKQKPRYDGHCRNLVAELNQPFVVRFKNPQSGAVTFDDQVRGKITVQNSELDDLIIARSDGTPTYNFTVVVDDLDMKITHVIRGDDHINNTPRQINILTALGAVPQIYAHAPMILGADGKRLSKRHGAVSVLQYRDEGYLPEALLNYLVRLGWSYGDQEIFSIDEMIAHFKLTDINRAPSTFNPEKLLWLNQHYLKTTAPEKIIKPLTWQLQRLNIDSTNGPELIEIITAQRERVKTLVEMAERSRFFFEDFQHYDEKVAQKELTAESLPILKTLHEQLQNLPNWNKDAMHANLVKIAEDANVKIGKIAQPLRVATTGSNVSPPIDITLQLLGKEKTLTRITRAIDYIEK